MPTIPQESELTAAVISLKNKDPSLGISRVHTLLLQTYPEWTVSEKRTRKILQSQGLIVSDPSSNSMSSESAKSRIYPSSRVIDSLDISQWTPKVKVKYFNKKKGKGLVAEKDIEEGEPIWKEDPFIIAPEWEILDMQMKSAACGYCTTPLASDSRLINPCPASSSSNFCPARFCNRLCLARSAKTHPLLCPAQNPASIPLMKWARETQWMALNALAQCTSRILLANQVGEETLKGDWLIVKGLAVLGMEERFLHSFSSSIDPEPARDSWKKAYVLFLQAFKEPKTVQEQKKLAKLLTKPLPAHVEPDLFDYSLGFLRGLGMMSLNLEAHGGLYTLHAHLNHSCNPNVSVRHLDQRNALSRITVLAQRPIKVGEELLVTYVNPKLGYKQRQDELSAWGFGKCRCERCLKDVKNVVEEDLGMDDLAKELKAGLGVM
ncbi:SET domain-containing protein [Phlegmacium glaucopus]|nr:SET domain-containing protein [Phlegmacium glaucopus]